MVIDLDFAIKIVAIIALLSVVILTMYVVISLRSAKKLMDEASNAMIKLTDEISKSMKMITKDITDFKEQAIISLKNIDELSEQIQNTTQKLENEIDEVSNIFQPFSKLSNDLYNKIAPPVNRAASFITATSKAINTFYSFFKK
ncbi:MAG: DUF948 domain-containing protein [Candidatus Woesearchaeota archaeon]